MGYRSDIDVVFYVPAGSETAYPLLKLWFDANYPHAEAKGEWDASIDYDEENQAILVGYHDVKWYSDYEHVKTVEKTFDDIDGLIHNDTITTVTEDDTDAVPFEIAWEFVRIGEDDNDIETRASDNADYVITVNRSTDISFTNRRPV